MILAVTVDLPTILPLKASFESGLLERSDHYLKYSCGKRKKNKKNKKPQPNPNFKKKEEISTSRNTFIKKQYIIELHLLNKKRNIAVKGS